MFYTATQLMPTHHDVCIQHHNHVFPSSDIISNYTASYFLTAAKLADHREESTMQRVVEETNEEVRS